MAAFKSPNDVLGCMTVLIWECSWVLWAETYKSSERSHPHTDKDERSNLLFTKGSDMCDFQSLMFLIFVFSDVIKLSSEARRVSQYQKWCSDYTGQSCIGDILFDNYSSVAFFFNWSDYLLSKWCSSKVTCCVPATWQGVQSSEDYGHFLPSGVRAILLISCFLLGQSSDLVLAWDTVGGAEVQWWVAHSKKVLPWFSSHSQKTMCRNQSRNIFLSTLAFHPQ